MVEVNKLVRSDRGLQQAFGRSRCAEQSVIQETLDASIAENVSELHHARRGFAEQFLNVLTIIHNFGPKRTDDTTAAQRLFSHEFPDLSE